MIRVILPCILVIAAVQRVDTASLTEAKALFSNISSGYNKNMRPIDDQDGTLSLYIDMYLLSIKDFDEVSGTLNILGAFMIKWNDVSLVWDRASYGGLNKVYIEQNNIWLPKLYNIKASNQFTAISDSDMSVKIYYDGRVVWSPGGFFDVKCTPDVSYFPFDTQTCSIQLSVWGYSKQDVKLETPKTEIQLNFYETNGEWSLDKSSVGNFSLGDYSIASFNITISRLPAFHVVNTLMPIYLLMIMNPLVFMLPCDSGERVGFSLTVFLTFSVFITIVNAALPATSDNMSKLSYFIFIVLVVSGIIASINILQLRMYHRDENVPVPRWIARLMRVLDCQFKSRRRVIVVYPKQTDQNSLSKSIDKKGLKKLTEEETPDKIPEMTWKEVVRIMDKFYTCLFFLVVTAFTIATIVILYFGHE